MFLVIVFALLAGVSAVHAAAPLPADEGGIVIRVEGKGWGEVERDTLAAVFHAVADELMPRWRETLPASVVVTHTSGNPVALYDRGSRGEYQVRLHASGERWHLHVYEFAHEFCHLASNHDAHAEAGMPRHNQWFEESLCEAASLFALKAVAARWKASATDSPWLVRAQPLRRFHDRLLAEEHRRLPESVTVAEWLRDNEASLRSDPYQRQKNEVVAILLLPLFERDPANRAALGYLNLDAGDGMSSLQDYLHHWHRNTPQDYRVLVAGVIRVLQGDASGAAADLLAYARPDKQLAASR